MVYHLTVEVRRPPAWASHVGRDEYARRLRNGLGRLGRDVSLRWLDDSRGELLLRYEAAAAGRSPHQAAVEAVMRGVEHAGLYATGATVTRVLTHWTQGAIAGALTGLGLSATQEDDLRPAITIAAIVVGAFAGAFLRRDVPVFRAALLPATGWRLIAVEPEEHAPRFRVGLV